MFPYEEGKSFAEYVHNKGGYDAIDRAYSNPPKTTEQIYHPEKYMSNEKIISVELLDISSELGGGWELAYDNVMGEFDVYELFKPYFTRKTARLASEGWGGSNYQFYRSEGGEKLLVQGYAWDSDQDAQEFSSAYIKYLEERFGKELKSASPSGSWMLWSTKEYQLGLKKDGVYTYVVQSTNGEPFDMAMGKLGDKGDQIEENTVTEGAQKQGSASEDYRWLIIGVVIGLLVLGLILVVVMLVLYRRPPSPPYPPGGPYGPYYYPGGRPPGPYYGPPGGYGGSVGPPPPPPGPYYGGPGGPGGGAPGGAPYSGSPVGWGQVPPPPPSQTPPLAPAKRAPVPKPQAPSQHAPPEPPVQAEPPSQSQVPPTLGPPESPSPPAEG